MTFIFPILIPLLTGVIGLLAWNWRTAQRVLSVLGATGLLGAGLALLAAAGGIIAHRQNRIFLWMSLWWVTAFTVPYAVSVAGNTRYRLPVEPVLVILSAIFFREVLLKWRKDWHGMSYSPGLGRATDPQKGE